jgi:hypothetical protein
LGVSLPSLTQPTRIIEIEGYEDWAIFLRIYVDTCLRYADAKLFQRLES